MAAAKEYLEYIQLAEENGLLSVTHNAPASFTGEMEGGKCYRVRGVPFHVERQYDVLGAVGFGAYGVVCAAVDLRLCSRSPWYSERLIRVEEEGLVVERESDERGSTRLSSAKPFLDKDKPSTVIRVPTLRFEPFRRRRLNQGRPSPFVAIKKVPKVLHDLVDGRRILREIKLLQHLIGHPNIIRIHDVMYPPRATSDPLTDIYIVTDLMDTDVGALLKSNQPIEEEHFRFIAYQLIKALVYVHSSGVIHRDLKPGNILLNGDCTAKLCDFGLARGGIPLYVPNEHGENREKGEGHHASPFEQYRFSASSWRDAMGCGRQEEILVGDEPSDVSPAGVSDDDAPAYSLTDYVVTRYYRAPELLVMSRYNHAIDMWSVGCILGEMLLRRPLFCGTNYLSQLTLILETPGLQGVPTVPSGVDDLFEGGEEGKFFIKDVLFHGEGTRAAQGETTPRREGRSGAFAEAALRSALFGSSTVPRGVVPLLSRLLHLDPRARPTAQEALRDPYFAPLYSPGDEILRCGHMPRSAYQSIWTESEVRERQGVVRDCPKPFVWEFDHRITDARDLQELFHEEVCGYADLKDQLLQGVTPRSTSAQ